MRLEEGDERCKQLRIARPAAEFIRPDSGQFEEPLRPTVVEQRCRKRGERDGRCVERTLIWIIFRQCLTSAVSNEGRSWRRS